MPQAGDTKWVETNRFSSTDEIKAELGLVESATNWSSNVGTLTTFAGVVALGVTDVAVGAGISFVGLGAISASTYYSLYESELRDLLDTIESLPDGTPFTILQRFKWHAGKRCWRPQNLFKVETE